MKKLLLMALLGWLCPVSLIAAFDRTAGIGKDRESISNIELASRAKAAADAQEFWLLRQPCTQKAPDRIFHSDYTKKIQEMAEKTGIDIYWPTSLFFVESCGDPNAKSPTGPAGLGQHSKASAKEQGLIIRDIKRKIGTHLETIYRWRGKGKNRKRVVSGHKKVTDYAVTHIDERLIPARAIEATMNRLAQRKSWYGDISWAVVDYHMGTGNLMKALSLYVGHPVFVKTAKSEIEKFHLTWEKVFFNNTPYFHSALYDLLLKLRAKNDFSPTYLFRILKARELLRLYRENPNLYQARFDSNQNRFRPKEVTPNLMWSFFSPEDVAKLRFDTLQEIQEATKTGRLVVLPRPWAKFGIDVRLDGPSPIGQTDRANQKDYIAAERPTLGCLLYVVSELKRLEGKRFVPFEINSLIRSDETQTAIKRTNRNADTLLPTHTMGKAFDIPRLSMAAWRKKDLQFILYDMEIEGMLAFISEGKQDTAHVVPHPSYEDYFDLYYRQAVLGK